MIGTGRPPGYWQDEATGVLRPVILAYLSGASLDAQQCSTIRAYLRQWINSPIWDSNPYAGPEQHLSLAALRLAVENCTDRAGIKYWLEAAEAHGLDPL
jgi:hypothetical protein